MKALLKRQRLARWLTHDESVGAEVALKNHLALAIAAHFAGYDPYWHPFNFNRPTQG